MDFSARLIRWHRPIAFIAAVASFVLGSLGGQDQSRGPAFWALFIGAAATTAVAVGIPMYAQHDSAERADDAELAATAAKVQVRLVIARVLTPLAYLLGEITDARPRTAQLERLQGQVMQAILVAAKELVGPDDARAAFFKLDPRGHRLLLAGYYGRPEPAAVTLVAGDEVGNEALRLIASDEIAYYPDLAEVAPPGWWPGDDRQRGVIGVPVTTELSKFGLLTIDTRLPGELREQDVEIVRLLAELLAAALNR